LLNILVSFQINVLNVSILKHIHSKFSKDANKTYNIKEGKGLKKPIPAFVTLVSTHFSYIWPSFPFVLYIQKKGERLIYLPLFGSRGWCGWELICS